MAATNVQAFSGDLDIAGAITSNLEVGTANLFVDTINSRVGIGLTTPQAPFTIKAKKGNILASTLDDLVANATIRINDTYSALGADNLVIGMLGTDQVTDTGDNPYPYLQTSWDLTLSGPRPMLLNPVGGNVGIGTNSPGAPLEIFTTTEGSSSTLILKRDVSTYGNSDDGAAIEFKTRWTNGTTYGQARIRGVDVESLDSGEGGLAFDTLNNQVYYERMRINNGGNVGIGTNNPGTTFKLMVNGGAVPSSYPFGVGPVNTNRSTYYSYPFSGPNNAVTITTRNFVVGGAERVGWLRVHKAGAASGSGNVQDSRTAAFLICPYGYFTRYSPEQVGGYGASAVQVQPTGAFNGFRVRIDGAGSYHSGWIEIYHPAGIYW